MSGSSSVLFSESAQFPLDGPGQDLPRLKQIDFSSSKEAKEFCSGMLQKCPVALGYSCPLGAGRLLSEGLGGGSDLGPGPAALLPPGGPHSDSSSLESVHATRWEDATVSPPLLS